MFSFKLPCFAFAFRLDVVKHLELPFVSEMCFANKTSTCSEINQDLVCHVCALSCHHSDKKMNKYINKSINIMPTVALLDEQLC